MPVYPYNEVRPRLGELVFIAQRALISEIAARYARLEDGYRRVFAGEGA